MNLLRPLFSVSAFQHFGFQRLLLCVLLAGSHALHAQTASTTWSVGVLDRILAAVPPGQNLAQVGDMQIRVSNLRTWRNQLTAQPTPQAAFDGTAPLWTAGNVYYTFDGSVSAAHQKAFLDGANEWATFANLHLVPRTSQSNYVTIQEIAFLEGGQSAVGMVGGQQFLSIGPTSWNRPTVCHEFGHTLGLVHEHQRSDRDSFVVILTNNIAPGEEGNFVLLPNSRNQGPYDFLCVMHYSRNSLSATNTLDTVEPLPAYSQFLDVMGQQFDPVLSAEDRAGMATNYGVGLPVTGVVTNTQDSGPGSLRAALYFAFDHPGATVTFNIPTNDPGFSNQVFTIQPTDRFPSLVRATTLNGTTQTNLNPNGPAIQLNGALAQPPSVFPNGLRLGGTNCSVRGLILNGFPLSGILIDGTNATGNTVSGCYLGVDASGTVAVTNRFPPITIDNGASRNTVGGTNASARNIISGSAFQGLVIRDPGTRANVVEGNYIGLNASGTAALSNTWSGVAIFNGAQSNLIGGTLPGTRNIISGNGLQGIVIADTNSDGNVIQNNYIGLNPAGTAAITNGGTGIDIYNGPHGTLIGGTGAGAGNVISGNQNPGIYIHAPGTLGTIIQGNLIGLSAAGTNAIPNSAAGVQISEGAVSNLVGGTLPRTGNVIAGNGLQGLLLGSSGNVVQGNYVGVNAAGTLAISNGWSGVDLAAGAQANLIGGTVPGTGNLISGNGLQGVLLQDPGTRGNIVQGNYIGVNFGGTSAIPNGWSGVDIYNGPQGNLIGGTTAAAANLISGNGNYGVVLSVPGTAGNLVQGNYIGLNASGNAALPNAFAGVGLFNGAQSNLIGGILPGTRNLISGNTGQGVAIGDPTTTDNLIQGNYIGLDVSGTAAVPNHGYAGVDIFNSAQGNVIGGGIGARNIVSGNSGNGISLSGNAAAHIIQGNTIGLNASSTAALGNGSAGITLFGGAVSNQIGGTGLGAANFIANSVSDGVRMFAATTTNNTVRGNAIFANGGAGIALNTSANNFLLPPSLTSAFLVTNTAVSGRLTNSPSTTFHLDFYANPPPLSAAQARTWLGARDVATSAGGTATFSASLGAVVPAGQIITATATDPAGNTSPLSAGVAVAATDSVGDGIPNAWRAIYFGGSGNTTNSQSCASCDPDHDGMSNLQEFLSGTNPTNAASALRITAINRAGADMTVSFNSVTGIVYRIETRTDLGLGVWSVLADEILGTGAVLPITQPGAAALPRQFYRVGAEP
ncbi:MAG TPA: M12 family metallopeptidase [Candidatus Binatia bacterium]|nr:M12 family metallopeptidase [Candidatus Binatia bacterium]